MAIADLSESGRPLPTHPSVDLEVLDLLGLALSSRSEGANVLQRSMQGVVSWRVPEIKGRIPRQREESCVPGGERTLGAARVARASVGASIVVASGAGVES